MNVIKLARQAGYLEPLIFLVASSQDTIGRAYRNGREEALRITDDEWSIPKGWLARIQVLTDEAMPYGVLYDPKCNGVVRLAASAARFIMDKQRQQRARSLPAEEWEALESKLREAFHNDQHTFLQRTPTYLDTGELYQLEILLQNSCNLRCRYCFAEGGTYGQQAVRLTPEQGRRIIRAFIKYPKLPFLAGNPLHFQTQWKPFVTNVPDSLRAVECRKPQNFLSLRIAFQFLKNAWRCSIAIGFTSQSVSMDLLKSMISFGSSPTATKLMTWYSEIFRNYGRTELNLPWWRQPIRQFTKEPDCPERKP